MPGKSLSSRSHLGASFSHFVCSVFSFWFRKKIAVYFKYAPSQHKPWMSLFKCQDKWTFAILRIWKTHFTTAIHLVSHDTDVKGQLVWNSDMPKDMYDTLGMNCWLQQYAGPLNALHRQMRCNKKFKGRIVVHLSSLHINNISLYLFLKRKKITLTLPWPAYSLSLH